MPNREFDTLYHKVKFFIGFKVRDENGKATNLGLRLPMEWTIQSAYTNLEKQYEYTFPKIQEQFGTVFESLSGRALQLSDLRASFCPADEKLFAVYLDDVDDCVPAHLLVETSPGSWHAHFRTSRPCTEDEAMAVIRMLRDWYGGDPGAAKARQGRRFIAPGMQFETNWDEPDIDVEFAVKHYPKEEAEDGDELVSALGARVALSEAEKKMYPEIWTRIVRNMKGRASDADYGLAMYVLEKGGTPEKAREAILCSRPRIIEEKGAYLAKYLSKIFMRTAEKMKEKAAVPVTKDLSERL